MSDDVVINISANALRARREIRAVARELRAVEAHQLRFDKQRDLQEHRRAQRFDRDHRRWETIRRNKQTHQRGLMAEAGRAQRHAENLEQRRRRLAEGARRFDERERARASRHRDMMGHRAAVLAGRSGSRQGSVSHMRSLGTAAGFAQRGIGNLQNTLLSYRSWIAGSIALMGGRSFLDATIGSADDMQRSRLLLRASLGDMTKVNEAYSSAVRLAREIGPLTRQEALSSMRFMVPLAGGDIEQAEELTRMAKALEVTNPEQNFSGALFSLRELIGSGQVRSLRERFNISGLPTRREAERLSRRQGKSVAEVYMNAFRGRLDDLYGQGGTDGVTALLAAETSTVRGQVRMLATIFQDALADLGEGPTGFLTDRLNLTIDRAREFVESDQFIEMADSISKGLTVGFDRFIGFMENLDSHLAAADNFLDRHGSTIATIAKLYALNFVTGGAVVSLAKGAITAGAPLMAGAGRSLAVNAASGAAAGLGAAKGPAAVRAGAGALRTALLGGALRSNIWGNTAPGAQRIRDMRFFGRYGRGSSARASWKIAGRRTARGFARAGGRAAVGRVATMAALKAGGLAALPFALAGLAHHLVNTSEAAEEAAAGLKAARDRFLNDRVEKTRTHKDTFTTLDMTTRAVRGEMLEQIQADLKGQRHSGLGTPTLWQGETPIYGTRNVLTPQTTGNIVGNIQGYFGSEFEAEEQAGLNSINNLLQQYGVSIEGLTPGASTSSLRFVGGEAGMTDAQRRQATALQEYRELSDEDRENMRRILSVSGRLSQTDALLQQTAIMLENSTGVAAALNAAIASQPMAVVEPGGIQIFGELSEGTVEMLVNQLTPTMAEVYNGLQAEAAQD